MDYALCMADANIYGGYVHFFTLIRKESRFLPVTALSLFICFLFVCITCGKPANYNPLILKEANLPLMFKH